MTNPIKSMVLPFKMQRVCILCPIAWPNHAWWTKIHRYECVHLCFLHKKYIFLVKFTIKSIKNPFLSFNPCFFCMQHKKIIHACIKNIILCYKIMFFRVKTALWAFPVLCAKKVVKHMKVMFLTIKTCFFYGFKKKTLCNPYTTLVQPLYNPCTTMKITFKQWKKYFFMMKSVFHPLKHLFQGKNLS